MFLFVCLFSLCNSTQNYHSTADTGISHAGLEVYDSGRSKRGTLRFGTFAATGDPVKSIKEKIKDHLDHI